MRASGHPATALLLLALSPALPAALLAAAPSALAQHVRGQRLILKDGSYQIVTKYEKKGDRVHYFSAERNDWEDIPDELIDWPATEKWNKEHQPGAPVPPPAQNASAQSQAATPVDQQEAAEIDRQAAAEKADQQARMPTVVPGLQLPDQDGIFVLDYFQGIPELIHLDQSTGNVNREASHNILRAAIASLHGAQEPVRLDGQSAKVRLHVNDPALYVSLDSSTVQTAPESAFVVDTHGANTGSDKDSFSSPDSRYVIVRVEVRPRQRVIGAVRISRAGDVRQSEDIVPTKSEILPGKHWMKLTPREPLDIGEYALMEILGPGQINLDVWDFGVSPNAPENKHPITPVKE